MCVVHLFQGREKATVTGIPVPYRPKCGLVVSTVLSRQPLYIVWISLPMHTSHQVQACSVLREDGWMTSPVPEDKAILTTSSQ